MDTVKIEFSLSKTIWYGGTSYLHIKANGPGVYSDTKTTVATVAISEGSQATVYVCGDDHNPLPDGWIVEEKYLSLYVDGKKVYGLGREYWWARCYSKAATIGPGSHEVKLIIHFSIRVTSNVNLERDIAYAAMDIKLDESGVLQAESHKAESDLDGSATHFFTFRLPEASGVGTINWKAVWNNVEKTGSGTPGSTQKVSFIGINRASWVFKSPVVIIVGDNPPSIQPNEGYSISAVYDEGSQLGVRSLAVALSNGDEVGFTSGKYLVTAIEYLGLNLTGCTSVEGLDAWANSGSSVHWAQKTRFYGANGWVVEEVASGVETGSCTLRKIGGGIFSRKIGFSSKNRSDEITLTVSVPQATLHFDAVKAEPVGSTDLGLRRLGEIVELKVKTLDCLGEYSRIDVYKVSESSLGVKKYTYSPVKGVYRGINSTVGGNVTFRVRWSSYSLMVKDVSGGVLRNGVYWTKSGSKVEVMVSACYSDDGSPAVGVRIRDSDGNEASTDLEGVVKFSHVKNDCEAHLMYVVVDEQGNRLSEEAGLTIVFTSIRLSLSNVDGVFWEGSYYVCNDVTANILVKAVYSHSLTPVSGALVEFKPSGLSASTGLDGVASLRLSGRDTSYAGDIKASDDFLSSSVSIRVVFTRLVLEARGEKFVRRPGEEVEVTVEARFTFNNMAIKGIRVRWVEGGLVKETPASFMLRMPAKGFLKASFEAVEFLPCVEPCTVFLCSEMVRFGEPNSTKPTIVLNNIIWSNYSCEVMLNIRELLNLTIPRVVWYGNGSVVYGVKIGVVSSNGTVVRSGIVSSNGISFNWTESKPGVYYYFVKALEKNVSSDVLTIKAIFTAFNITLQHILDLNDTHLVFATAYWAHNNSPVSKLPVHTALSGKRMVSKEDGSIILTLNDSDYNASCVEKIVILKSDPHLSGIWRTLDNYTIRVVKLSLRAYMLIGDQYGLEILLSLDSMEDGVSIPLRVRVEGYSPSFSSMIRILQARSDNSSMSVFITSSCNFLFEEMFALKIEKAEYDGSDIAVGVRSLARNLTIRNIIIGIANSTLNMVVGDLQPGSYVETVFKIPEEFNANPIILVAYSNNTVPYIVKVWRKPAMNIFALISIIPLLVALAIRLRNRNRDSEKQCDKKAKNDSEHKRED